MLKSQPFIVFGWVPWSKKRINYLSCIEGMGVWKTFTVVHKMTYYYKISLWNIKYSFINLLKFISRLAKLFIKKQWIFSTKILLVNPKFEIIFGAPSNYSYFPYCNSNIGLFTFALLLALNPIKLLLIQLVQ